MVLDKDVDLAIIEKEAKDKIYHCFERFAKDRDNLDINPEVRLYELDLDSLDYIDLLSSIDDTLGVIVPANTALLLYRKDELDITAAVDLIYDIIEEQLILANSM